MTGTGAGSGAAPGPAYPRLPRSRRTLAAVLASSWFWGAIVTVLAWRLVLLGPQGGFDPSWQTGLAMAAHEHLQYGRQIMFTYGPLGFLQFPMLAYAGSLRLAYVYALLIKLGLAVALIGALRRTYGSLSLAVVLSLLLIGVPFDAPVVLAAVVAMGALHSPPAPRRGYLLAFGAGLLSALEILGKFNTGTTIAAISFVTVLALPEKRRTMSVFLGTFVIFVLTFWLLAHQRLDNLWAFFHTSLSVVSGYSQTLGLELPGEQWQYWLALLLFILGLIAALRSGGLSEQPRRKGLVVVWIVLAFLEFKEGFVRHDQHAIQYFALLLGSFVGFRWRPGRRGFGAVMWMVFVAAYFGVAHADPVALIAPGSSVKRFFAEAREVTNDTKLTNDIALSRRALISAYALDRTTYDLVRGQRVDVEPYEDTLAWAYDLHWSPTPEFQAFTAYTTLLDNANAKTFAQAGGPTRVLSETPRSGDGRFPSFDAPAATRALLCHFVPVHVTAAWDVLARVDDRCGPERPLLTTRAAAGQTVTVPPPPASNELVMVRIRGVQVAGFEQVVTTLFRARSRYITLNGAPYRLVPGTAGDGLLLDVPVRADYPGAFRLGPNAHTISAGVTGSSSRQKSLTYSFSTMTIRPLPSGAG